MIWPDGRKFAFSIFDDTDLSTIENVGLVYSFLKNNGILTTKSVWPIKGQQKPTIGGDTCENPEYLAWVKSLQADGFEIAFHNATFHTSTREETLRGLQKFHEYFGHWPKSMANHADCRENIYWGQDRLTGLRKLLYNILTKGKRINFNRGHIEGDTLFWGDYCKKYITYVRNFVFDEINTLKQCPFMPYHDPQRPYVNFWFASTEGAKVQSFNSALSEKNQDRLEAEGGACIMYTHFANSFCIGGRLDKRFESLIKRLAKKSGWFVPVSTLLDYLKEHNGEHAITRAQKAMLERKWLWHKIKVGTT
jgi:hypothetical protein